MAGALVHALRGRERLERWGGLIRVRGRGERYGALGRLNSERGQKD